MAPQRRARHLGQRHGAAVRLQDPPARVAVDQGAGQVVFGLARLEVRSKVAARPRKKKIRSEKRLLVLVAGGRRRHLRLTPRPRRRSWPPRRTLPAVRRAARGERRGLLEQADAVVRGARFCSR